MPRADWKLIVEAPSVPALNKRLRSMKLIFKKAPAHLSGVADKVITALPPLAVKACIAAQVAWAA